MSKTYTSKDKLQRLVTYMASQISIPVIGSGGGYAPIGSIIAFMGITAPESYLICDGQTYNITDYQDLADFFESHFGTKNYFGGDGVTTFAVPDLRGEFLRGTGTNSHINQGSGSNVGMHQDGTEIPWVGTNQAGTLVNVRKKDTTTTTNFPKNLDSQMNPTTNMSQASATYKTSASSNTLGENYTSRPTNTSVLYCIKAIANEPGEYTAGDGIDITDGEISTDNMPATDMSEIITPLPSVMSRRMKYSADEQIVGEWIDGKSIYQKTIYIPALPNKTSTDYPHGILNIENIIDIEAIAHSASGYYSKLPNVHVSTLSNGIALSVTNTIISINAGSADRSTMSAYITLKYTKTTD